MLFPEDWRHPIGACVSLSRLGASGLSCVHVGMSVVVFGLSVVGGDRCAVVGKAWRTRGWEACGAGDIAFAVRKQREP